MVRYESMAEIHPYFHLNLPIFWLATCNYIGNSNIDLFVSPTDWNLSLSWLENGLHSYSCHYKQICPNYVTQHMKLLMLDMHCISTSDSTPEILGIYYLLSTWITQRSLSARHLSDSAHDWLDTHCNSAWSYIYMLYLECITSLAWTK